MAESFAVPDGVTPADPETLQVLGRELQSWWVRLTIPQRLSVYAAAADAFQPAHKDEPHA